MDAITVIQAPVAALYLLTVSVVGCRLVMLAHRTGQSPERLLGLALLLGGALGGPLEAAGLAGRDDLAPSITGGLLTAGKLFGMVAFACHCAFIWRVFRPSEAWAPWLAAALVALPVTALGGALASGMASSGSVPLGWFWLEQVGRVAASCWLVAEGALYHGMMKRRLQIGLADALVTNRFLLWTVAGCCSVVLLLTAIPPMFLDAKEYELLLMADLLVFSLAGVAVSAFYMLAFLPPRAYRRFIRERRAVESV